MKTITELNELRAKRAAAITNARAILDTAEKDNKRALTTAEQTAWDGFHTEANTISNTIKVEERQNAAESEAANPGQRQNNNPAEIVEDDDETDPQKRAAKAANLRKRGTPQYRAVYNKFLTRGLTALTDAERRDLSSDSDADGGYLVMPEQTAGELLSNLDDEVYVRSKARKFRLLTAKSLGVIKRTAKLSTWVRGGEVTPPTKDSSLKYGKRALFPSYMSGLALVSRDLLRNSTQPADQIVNGEMVRDAGEVQEQEFMTGSGAAGSALGVFTASADGISTGRDISTGNLATSITFDGLIEAKFGLKERYRRTAEWMFSRTGVKQIAKLKDGEGRYIWEPSKVAGEPDRILALPYVESEWVPSTFTSGLYVGILANWQFYWIADALDIEIQRLVELYALSNQDGFVGRLKMDAAPQLEEAFVRVKLG